MATQWTPISELDVEKHAQTLDINSECIMLLVDNVVEHQVRLHNGQWEHWDDSDYSSVNHYYAPLNHDKITHFCEIVFPGKQPILV
jgi:hypothetical protein